MTYFFLYLEVRFRPEVIERVLRVVRHRGFILHTLHMFPSGRVINHECKLYVHMTVISTRSISILYEHLNKLTDVFSIVVQDSNENSNNFLV